MAQRIYYWATHRDTQAIQQGFVVPPWEPRPGQQLVELIFERIRAGEFPSRPSRDGAVFVCPKKVGFCGGRRSSTTVFKVLVKGKTFTTDAEYYTEAMMVSHKIPYHMKKEEIVDWMRTEIERWARSYWEGKISSSIHFPETIVHGKVVVIERV